jgi:murein DD-endopeptidase MepM/ murein hydrolase activator NlpD
MGRIPPRVLHPLLPARLRVLLPLAWLLAAVGPGPATAQVSPPVSGQSTPAEAAPSLPLPSPPPPRPAVLPTEVAVGDLLGNDEQAETRDSERRVAPALTYPLALPASEVDPWGWRFSPSRNAWRMHTGIDLIVPAGTAVRAVLPGRVRLVERIDGYGLTVVIDHGQGLQSLYGHLLEASAAPGDSIDAGRSLGRVGQSGNATTPHLHLELRRHTQGGLVAVDPTPHLPAGPTTLAAGVVPAAEPPVPPPPFPDSASGP